MIAHRDKHLLSTRQCTVTRRWELHQPIPARWFPLIYPAILTVVVIQLTVCGAHLIPDTGPETSNLETSNLETSNLEPINQRQISAQCPYPCKCKTPQCKAGVSIKKDGCGCCSICTRQQGDLCDAKDICDVDRGLYCDFKLDGGLKGICRAREAKPCTVDGTVYKDGEEFKWNCSLLCTCQNGQYSCSTLCPQEDRPPSPVHCKDPILVTIEKRCCKEWVCPHSHSLPDPNDPFNNNVEKRPPGKCKPNTNEWTPCSQTCGMGVSVRITNENENCETIQERRLCYIRPCTLDDQHLKGKDCKSTWKDPKTKTLVYGECKSVLSYRQKFCSTCKKRKCCGPGRTKTKKVQFKCPDGKLFTEKFMWIKNCECFSEKKCPF